jgi:hypothetical protein
MCESQNNRTIDGQLKPRTYDWSAAMDSALIIDAGLLAAVLQVDLGPHRTIGRHGILRPHLTGISVRRIGIQRPVQLSRDLRVRVDPSAPVDVRRLLVASPLPPPEQPHPGLPHAWTRR